VKVYNLYRVKTDRSVVLTVKSGLDPYMINKLEDGIKLWFMYGLRWKVFESLFKWDGINLYLVNMCLLIKFDKH
jgi:hypothetical protein